MYDGKIVKTRLKWAAHVEKMNEDGLSSTANMSTRRREGRDADGGTE